MRSSRTLVALIVAAGAGGCDNSPVTPPAPVVVGVNGTSREIPGFFSAFSWHDHAYTSPIITQPYDASQCYTNPAVPCLNDALYRQQWNNIWDWQHVAEWAATHRGHLYILGDQLHEAGFARLYEHDPAGWARDYCTFVREVRKVDPTSAFSPSLIEHWAPDAWIDALAAALAANVQNGTCSTKPVAEWEFNFYPNWSAGLAGFQAFVDRKVRWATSQPAEIRVPVMMSAFTVAWYGDDVPNDDPAYLARLREVKAWLFARENVVHAQYLDYETYPDDFPDPHPLTNRDGTLNATGRVFAEVTGRIAGPRVIPPGSTCTWTAETTGGPAPFGFQWLANGTEVARQPAISVIRPDSAFVLEMIVTDASGGFSRARLEVKIAAAAPPCS